MKYSVRNKLNRQVNLNLDGTSNTKTTVILPPMALKKVEMTGGQYQYVKSNYGKQLLIKRLEG